MKTNELNTNFGKMILMSDGDVTLGVTTEQGMRISHISAFGGENLAFADYDFKAVTKFDNGVVWNQLGGHRLWKSPEDVDCYAYDNIPSTFTLTDNGGYFTNKTQGDGLKFALKIEFLGDNKVKLTHEITNVNDFVKTLGLWSITALKSYGVATLPLDTADTVLLPNRNISLWSYTKLDDKRLALHDDKVMVMADDTMPPLKVGVHNSKGEVSYTDGKIVFTKHADDQKQGYPDFYCNVECYTNQDILEIETVSPIYDFAPNETKTHVEIWTFRRIK